MNVGDFRKSARHHLRRAVQFHRAGTLKTNKIGRNLEVIVKKLYYRNVVKNVSR
jgi:hypothetical protein